MDGLAVEFGKGLRRMVFRVAPEMCAAQPPQLLLGGGKAELGDFVGALHDGEDLAVGPQRHGMPEHAANVAVEVREDHRFRSVVGPASPLGVDLPALLVVAGPGGGLGQSSRAAQSSPSQFDGLRPH